MLNVFEKWKWIRNLHSPGSLVSSLVLCLLVSATYSSSAHGFTIKGIAYGSDGITPLTEKVNFTLSIYDSMRLCLLYQEKQLSVNLATSQGAFSLTVGELAPTNTKRVKGVDPQLSLDQIYQSTGQVIPPSASCPGYTASIGDLRFLRIQITRTTVNETITLSPEIPIDPQTRKITTITPIEATGTISQANLLKLVSGGDATALHNHDSRYVKISSGIPTDLGSGGSLFTGGNISIGTTSPQSIPLFVQPKDSVTIGQVIRASSLQSANLFEFRSSSGSVLSGFDASANLFLGTQISTNRVITKGYVDDLVSGAVTLALRIPEASVTWTSPAVNSIPANKFTCTAGNNVVKATSTGALCSTLSESEIPNFSWSKITTGKPATIAGYGITDTAQSSLNTTLTGTPRAPTASTNTNSTQIATTAFVIGQSSSTTPTFNEVATPGTATTFARADHVHPSDTTRALAANPTFTGTVSFPTSGVWNSSGNVGVGTTNPSARLDIKGQMRTVTTNAGAPSSHALTIDWNNGNIQYTSGDCSGPTTYTFQNILDGAIYTLAMTGTGGGTCIFTDGSNTFKFPTSGRSVASGSQAVFTFLRANSTVFVTWEEF